MVQSSHIRSAFDQDLEGVKAQVAKMGGLVEKALLSAADALESRDVALAASRYADDAAIDALEEMIQTECARIIAIRTPIATGFAHGSDRYASGGWAGTRGRLCQKLGQAHRCFGGNACRSMAHPPRSNA
jgi:hypothetical protein